MLFLCVFFYIQLAITIDDSSPLSINPKGPTLPNSATICLMKIINNKIPTSNGTQMITIVVQDDLDTPAFETAQAIIMALNQHKYFSVEINNGSRQEFESEQVCLNCPTDEEKIFKRYFKLVIKTNFLFIIDNPEEIDRMAKDVQRFKSFDSRKAFIIYYAKVIEKKNQRNATALEVLNYLYNNSMHYGVVLMPTDLVNSALFAFDLSPKNTYYCAATPKMTLVDQCIKGKYIQNRFKVRDTYENLNCIISVVMMETPPFILNKTVGIEVLLLEDISRVLNISFNFTVIDANEATDWGYKIKHNGTWVGPLKIIDDDLFTMGIGYCTMNTERMEDFEFTDNYLYENVVWVVPIAEKLPGWASILVIFEFNMWAGLLATLLFFAIVFYALSKFKHDEYNYLKMFGASFVMSLQVLIGSAAQTQPRTRLVRIPYLTLALFSILVISIYQGCLMDVTMNPRYEYQIDSEDEVFESGIGIGGIGAYRDIFNETSNPLSMRIFNNYEVYADVNNTMYMWVLTVAQDRDTITILGQLYVNYLLATHDKGVTNADHTPKVHIIKNALFTNQVRIVFKKGFPLKPALNQIIKRLFNAGFFSKWEKDFMHEGKINEEDEEEEEDRVTALQVKHLQGAFSLLIVGGLLAIFAFIMEQVVYRQKIVKRNLENRKRAQNRWKMIQKQVVKKESVKSVGGKQNEDFQKRGDAEKCIVNLVNDHAKRVEIELARNKNITLHNHIIVKKKDLNNI